jgi:predicted  nucleic acid-binding Zn-ribbon protein
MTPWRYRQKAAKRQKVLMIGLTVLTFLCGVGAGDWWNSEHSMVKQLSYDLEKTQYDLNMANHTLDRTGADLDTTRVELEKISKISDLRKHSEAIFLQVFDLQRKYSKIVEAADKNVGKNKRGKTKKELEVMWESELSPLKDQLTQLDNTLAELEQRAPRVFELPATPPMMLREMKK